MKDLNNLQAADWNEVWGTRMRRKTGGDEQKANVTLNAADLRDSHGLKENSVQSRRNGCRKPERPKGKAIGSPAADIDRLYLSDKPLTKTPANPLHANREFRPQPVSPEE